jgi:hypothetical protein
MTIEYPLTYLDDLIGDEGLMKFFNFNSYSLEVTIADNNNNNITITTDEKPRIDLLPKTIEEILNTYIELQNFVETYHDNYFLFISINYFDNFIETFYINVKKIKMMFKKHK